MLHALVAQEKNLNTVMDKELNLNLDFFSSPGRFYKGNLHTHSSRSDGILNPEEVCQRYLENGYDFIALTDHFLGLYDYPIVNTEEFRSDNFTTLLGAEVHAGSMENGEIWHILAVGLPKDFKPPNAPHFLPIEDQESGTELCKRCMKAGAFVSIAHPQWSGMTFQDAKTLAPHSHSVEIYNHGCAVDCDRPDGTHMLDLLSSAGFMLSAIATDDAHFKTNDYFGGWVNVKAKDNRPESLISALKCGHFYSSCGPSINGIVVNKKLVEVKSSEVNSVIVLGNGSSSNYYHGKNFTTTKISLEPFFNSNWIRIVLIDNEGNRAWTNPIWFRQ